WADELPDTEQWKPSKKDRDNFRHFAWGYTLTRIIDRKTAKGYTDANEVRPIRLYYPPSWKKGGAHFLNYLPSLADVEEDLIVNNAAMDRAEAKNKTNPFEVDLEKFKDSPEYRDATLERLGPEIMESFHQWRKERKE
ncbi:MAG: hypothetical protein AAF442_10150, partial [Pseudomonadota bacterium]